MAEDKKKARLAAGKAAKEARTEEAKPAAAPEPVAPAPQQEEPLPEGASITVELKGGQRRTYTEATHGPHYRTLARNFKVGQNGKYV